ncbi:hypothetical protein WN944_001872 [Citrus x changshan-huyou]|uniref:Uncharacterized protein n=1 Tax=Citrus x changshan-huyou TaxID=2935761 RepID=A0AAP0MFJ4_9ROSI
MKMCYRALMDAYSEFEKDLTSNGMLYGLPFAKELMKTLVRSYIIEAKCCEYVRKMEEYMCVALLSEMQRQPLPKALAARTMTAAHAVHAAAAQQLLSLSPSLVTISPSGLNCCYCNRVQPSPSHRPPETEVKAKASKDNVPTINVTQFGYFKVLGKGLLLENQLVVVKAKLVSKTAKKKIKKAGGTSAARFRREQAIFFPKSIESLHIHWFQLNNCTITTFKIATRTASPGSHRGWLRNHHFSTSATALVTEKIENAWKDINEEFMRPIVVPMPLLERVLNFACLMDVLYKNVDSHTNSTFPSNSVCSLLLEHLAPTMLLWGLEPLNFDQGRSGGDMVSFDPLRHGIKLSHTYHI